jgi:3-phosphoshikimate 1-carboxyvinyltransferase
MVQCLRDLGVTIDLDATQGIARVSGTAGKWRPGPVSLYVENSGTTIRFLTAAVALGEGHYRLDGNSRMRERPIGDLVAALRSLGVPCRTEFDNDRPPVSLESHGIPGGRAEVAGDVSSQFLSGLMLAAPYANRPVELAVRDQLVSKPYVSMTRNVMEAFGVPVFDAGDGVIQVPLQHYRGCDYLIEPDASAASYFWAAAAITHGSVIVEGLHPGSLQGDVAFCGCLERMGCQVSDKKSGIQVQGAPLIGIEVDMRDISDTVQTLAVVALFAKGTTSIRGVEHIRYKESDRIGDLARELRRLGADVDELADGLTIRPRPLHGATISTYQDHRMAMSLTLAGLAVPDVRIADPECVGKTYPGFFFDLDSLRGRDGNGEQNSS